MIVTERLEYSNGEIVEKGRKIRKLLEEISRIAEFDLKGSIIVRFNTVSEFKEKFPKFKEAMNNYHVKGLEVVLSVVKSGEFKHLVNLKMIADKYNLPIDCDYDRRKLIIYYIGSDENTDGLIELFNLGTLDKLDKVYHWEIKINDGIPTEKTVKLDKEPYTHLYFRPKRNVGSILANKHFSVIDNGKYTYAIDFGKIGDIIYKPGKIDIAMLTHNHVDHVGSLIHKDNERLKPIIVTNLPTVELILSKKYDFPERGDLKELMTKAFVNSKMFFGDTFVVNNIYSGHAYGTLFYIEDYLLGLSILYMSDINPSSKAFKFANIKKLSDNEPDVLAIEFPAYSKPRTYIPEQGIIGTTSGEYEEVLTLLPPGSRILIDENSTATAFEVVRRKFKSFLTKRAHKVKVLPGSVDDYLSSEADYLITTKGLAISYSLNNSLTGYVTNSKPDTKKVKVMKIKTHPTLEEIENIILEVNPKILIVHHYNGNIRRVSRLVSFVEKNTDVQKIYTTPPEGHFIKLVKKTA